MINSLQLNKQDINDAITNLQGSFKLFNGGRNWTKERLHRVEKRWFGLVKHHSYCALGAVHEVDGSGEVRATEYLHLAAVKLGAYGVAHYNDASVDFSRIQLLFETAIQIATMEMAKAV